MNLATTPTSTREYNEGIINCEDCPIDKRFEHELGWGTPGKIMFVGQCPAFSNRTGQQGTSDFDKFFLRLIGECGIQMGDFYFTNLVKVPVHIKDVQPVQLKHCAQHLLKEVEIIQPQAIICLGKFAYLYLKEAGVPVHSLLHPGAIAYGTATEESWKNEFKALLLKIDINTILRKEIV